MEREDNLIIIIESLFMQQSFWISNTIHLSWSNSILRIRNTLIKVKKRRKSGADCEWIVEKNIFFFFIE